MTLEGFGQEADILRFRGAHPDGLLMQKPSNYGGLSKGRAMTALFKPLSGHFTQTKYIPLRYCPLILEFEVVNGPNDPIIWPKPYTGTGIPPTPGPDYFTEKIAAMSGSFLKFN